MNVDDIAALIIRGRETREVEMKESMDLSIKAVKAKIAKQAMAMGNIRNGGLIIIGMEKQSGSDSHLPKGMTVEHLAEYSQDRVSSVIMEYAEPYIELSIEVFEVPHVPVLIGMKFVLISVQEFAEIPIICKKSYAPEGLREGAIYIRSRERIETREVQTEAEMREVMDLATEKRLRKHLEITSAGGGVIVAASADEETQFEDEAEDLA